MIRNILLVSLLLMASLSDVSAQVSASASSSSSASASASFSVASSQFSSSLEQATEQIVPELEADPQNLDQVLEAIAQAIMAELEKIAVALISETSIDASSVASEVGQAVSSALTSITEVQAYAELDVDSVVAQVESSVETILGKISAQPNVAQITEDLANAVIGAIGDAISEVSGATFTFKVTVNATTTTTSSTEEVASVQSSSDLLTLLEAGNIQAVITAMQKELTTGSELKVLEFLISASGNVTLQDSLIEVFIGIFAKKSFPMELLVEILVTESDLSADSLTLILQGAIAGATAAGKVNGLMAFIKFAFQGQATSFQDIVVSSFESAITSGGCTNSLSDVLASASKESSAFQGAILGSANASACASQGLEIQFSLSISTQLQTGDIATAFESVKTAQVSTIVASFVFSLSAGLTSEVSNLLVKFYGDESVTTEKLSLVIALFMRQDAQNATKIILDSISNTQDTISLIATFKYAFTQAESQVTEEFITLIARSIEGGSCGLSAIVEGVLADATAKQAKSITEQLVNGGAEACVPMVVAPVTEPTAPVESSTPTPTPTPVPVEEDDEPEGEEEDVPEVFPSPALTPSPVPAPTPSPTPSPEAQVDGCVDIAPPGGYTCEQQAAYGKCVRGWMFDGGFCAKTCGFCCDDVQPDDKYTCAQQKEFGKCDASWMIEGKFCRNTCGNCNLEVATPSPSPEASPDLSPSPEPTPSPTPAPSPTPSPAMKGEGEGCDCGCDCGCSCGCNAEHTANITATIVRDVVIQVLKELQS
eukprot:TRINITY_DN2456_c0_g1_i7.p1 TRINITY_DN2456_c0_g1~~TRINITY_DN2456_c0_g1_i7.p1  ORF type:complete len:771 (+),score=135.87 TRINITY_DN2456_c0_g1_i7:174-2486(+)